MNYENLKAIRKRRKLTQREAAERLGIGQSTYKNYEGGFREPSGELLVRMADLFGVTTDFLLRESPPPTVDPFDAFGPIDAMERDLIREWLKLDESARTAFLDVLRKVADADRARKSAQPEPLVSTRVGRLLIRFSRHKVSAGLGYDLSEEDLWDEMEVLDTWESRKADFAVEVDGDSMMPQFEDGDILLVESCQTIDPGEIGVFTVDGVGYVKQLGRNRLISLNPAYPPIPFNAETDIRCWGRVLGKAEIRG